MNRIVSVIMCFLLLILSYTIIAQPCKAEVFDIGKKLSESDNNIDNRKWYYYDSGFMIQTYPAYENLTKLILDGNESTGINHQFGPKRPNFIVVIWFPSNLYVHNITAKPKFAGNYTEYSVNIHLGLTAQMIEIKNESGMETRAQINGLVSSIGMSLNDYGTGNFSFNDLIINYSRTAPGNDSILKSIDELDKGIDDLNEKINKIYVSDDNQSKNITYLINLYEQLNNSINKNSYKIESLKNDLDKNITKLNQNITIIENELKKLNITINNLSANTSKIQALQQLIDQAFANISKINRDIADIQRNITQDKNDTLFFNRIDSLESNNSDINEQIEDLIKELDYLKGSVNDQKTDRNEIWTVNLIIILIAFVIIILSSYLFFRNRKEILEEPLKEHQVLRNIMLEIVNSEEPIDQEPSNKELSIKLAEKKQRKELSENGFEYLNTKFPPQKELKEYHEGTNTGSDDQRKS